MQISLCRACKRAGGGGSCIGTDKKSDSLEKVAEAEFAFFERNVNADGSEQK